MTDTTVCQTYTPPTNPEDSGFCAWCGMYDWRHPGTASDDTPRPWTLDHQVHLFAQTESRPGVLTIEGECWMDRQQTGKVMVVCTCGYTSGLIDHTELKATMDSLAAEHGAVPTGG